MIRFLLWFVIFLFVLGLTLHYKFDIPYFLSWIGKLPGDMTLRKEVTIYYVPITSAAVFSLLLLVITHMFSKKKK